MRTLSSINPIAIASCLVFCFACGKEDSGGGGGGTKLKGIGGDKSGKATAGWKVVSVKPHGRAPNAVVVTLKARKDVRVLPSDKAPPVTMPRQDHGAPTYRPFDHSDEGRMTFDVSELGSGKHEFTLTLTHHAMIGVKKQLTVTIERSGETKLVDSRFRGQRILECSGGHKCRVEFSLGALKVTGPAGTKVKFGSQTGTLSANEQLRVNLEPWPYLKGKTIAQIKAMKPSIPVELTFPDGKTASSTISGDELKPWSWAYTYYSYKEGGKKIEGEPAYNGKPRGLAHYGTVYGAPKTLAEIDLVATDKRKTDTKGCGVFKNKKKGSSRGYTLKRENKTVTVYDRRTGKQLHQKVFKAEFGRCPTVIGTKSESSLAEVPRDTIGGWLRGLVGKK